MTTQRFVHFTDPHLSTLERVPWTALLSKRVLGYWSWRRHRRFVHQPHLLEQMVVDAVQQEPQLMLVSGDLTHIGLASEHEEAASWLRRVNIAMPTCVVPGNHDLYRPDAVISLSKTWGMTTPFVKRLGRISIIGLSTAIPTHWLSAAGHIASTQLQELTSILANERGQLRVLLLHHSPHSKSHTFRKRLRNAAALRQVLNEQGVEMVLHGHSHRNRIEELRLQQRQVPVIGTASASAAEHAPERHASYRLFECRCSGNGVEVQCVTRAWNGREIIDSERTSWKFELPESAHVATESHR